MKQQMEQHIKAHFPEAVLDYYSESRWGVEYIFYPTPDAEEPFACILNSYGGFTILTEF